MSLVWLFQVAQNHKYKNAARTMTPAETAVQAFGAIDQYCGIYLLLSSKRNPTNKTQELPGLWTLDELIVPQCVASKGHQAHGKLFPQSTIPTLGVQGRVDKCSASAVLAVASPHAAPNKSIPHGCGMKLIEALKAACCSGPVANRRAETHEGVRLHALSTRA